MSTRHLHLHSATGLSKKQKYLRVGIVQIAVFMLEVVGWVFSGSVTLLGDACHVAFDALASWVGFIAVGSAERHKDLRVAHRIEAKGTKVNGFLLIVAALFLTITIIYHNSGVHEVNGVWALASLAVGLAANFFCVRIYGHTHDDDLMASARVHVLLDILSSFIAVVSTLLVALTGFAKFDLFFSIPLVFLFAGVGLWFIHRAYARLRKMQMDDAAEEEHGGGAA